MKIIKNMITCPNCSEDFTPERTETDFDVDIMVLLPKLGLKFEFKVFKNHNGERKSRFMKSLQ